MSQWSRLVNVLLGDHLNREIDEELEAHLKSIRVDAAAPGTEPRCETECVSRFFAGRHCLWLAILGVALLAALRPVMHAVRIDPASMLRGE